MFSPPHWNYKKIRFPKKEIDYVISNIRNNPFKEENISSYHADHLRPESMWLERYTKILTNMMCERGLGEHNFAFNYWAQLYLDGHKHTPHNHFKSGATISFVHFIKPSDKPLFRFLNFQGQFYVPTQETGSIICFPSWVYHEAVANESEQERFVVAGNVTTSVHPERDA